MVEWSVLMIESRRTYCPRLMCPDTLILTRQQTPHYRDMHLIYKLETSPHPSPYSALQSSSIDQHAGHVNFKTQTISA